MLDLLAMRDQEVLHPNAYITPEQAALIGQADGRPDDHADDHHCS